MLGLSLLLFAPLTLYTAASLARGTRLAGGYRKLCAFMRMRGRGTPTQATGTTAASSSYLELGNQWAASSGLTLQLHASSCTGRGSFISVTGDHGANGVQLGPVVYGDAVQYWRAVTGSDE